MKQYKAGDTIQVPEKINKLSKIRTLLGLNYNARVQFWDAVYKIYPELKNRKAVFNIDTGIITIK